MTFESDNLSKEELLAIDETLKGQAQDLGDKAFVEKHFCSVRDGFPPKSDNVAVLNPETFRCEVLNGNVPDEERLHHVALNTLIENYGSQQLVTSQMRDEFSCSASGPDSLAPLFNNTLSPGQS